VLARKKKEDPIREKRDAMWGESEYTSGERKVIDEAKSL